MQQTKGLYNYKGGEGKAIYQIMPFELYPVSEFHKSKAVNLGLPVKNDKVILS